MLTDPEGAKSIEEGAVLRGEAGGLLEGGGGGLEVSEALLALVLLQEDVDRVRAPGNRCRCASAVSAQMAW